MKHLISILTSLLMLTGLFANAQSSTLMPRPEYPRPQFERAQWMNLKDITFTVLEFDFVAGYCYTQLTDVEQEQNGIYNYDRTPKFDMEVIKSIFSKRPEKK